MLQSPPEAGPADPCVPHEVRGLPQCPASTCSALHPVLVAGLLLHVSREYVLSLVVIYLTRFNKIAT